MHAKVVVEGDRLVIVIPGQTPSKKSAQRILVNKKTGKPFILMNRRAKAWEDENVAMLTKIREENDAVRKWINSNKDRRLVVEMCFIRKSKKRWDYVNVAQSVLDVLVKAGYIKDDDYKHVVPKFSPSVIIDKEFPRVIVTLYKLIGGSYGKNNG